MRTGITYRLFTFLVIGAQLFSLLPANHGNALAANLNAASELPTTRVTAEHPPEPAVLSHPLAISRVQSNYSAGLTTIRFEITNNLPPARLPDISTSATVTDTVDILATHIITDDVNTLRNVIFEDTLAAGVLLLDASFEPVQNGATFTWQLGDLPPLGSAVLTLTVSTPPAGVGFLDLDSGAQVEAERWGQLVSSTARPALIIPNGIDAAYTHATPDANINDSDMLWKSAEFSQDPLALFAYVQGFGYDPYKGSLRGTRGTLWGEAGNSVDQASLLIAMLRAAGIPARYRHGMLSATDAQTLLASMFPAAQGLAGYLPTGVEVADPINDPELIAAAQEHWWVEAYLPGSGWTDMDPTFPGALVGDVFAVPGSNDRIAELPDNLRHKVTFALKVEQYNQFPIGGVNLVTFEPLVATYSVSELAAKAVTFGHLVSSDVPGGMVFSTVTHTYTPFFDVSGDEFLTTGDEFQDILTNFPLGSKFTTAEWLTISVTDLDSNTQTYERELKDLIGLDVRLNGGSPVLAIPADNRAFTSFNDAFAAWFLPNQVSNPQYAERSRAENPRAIISTAKMVEDLPLDLSTPAGSAALQQLALEYYWVRNQQYALAGLEFAKQADPAGEDIEKHLRVKLYYDQARLIITSSKEQADGTVAQAVDLRSTEAETIVYPEQAAGAAFTANWLKAVGESYFEGHAIYRLTGKEPLTVSRIFDEMQTQGIEPLLVTPANMALLDIVLPQREAYAYARQALLAGRSVLIPSAPVPVDGEPVLGWWEFDPVTGQVTSVFENGLHVSIVEYTMIVNVLDASLIFSDAAGTQAAVAQLWSCIAASVVPALQGNPGGGQSCSKAWMPPSPTPPWVPPISWGNCPPWNPCLNLANQTNEAQADLVSWRYLPAHLCPVDNCGIEQFVLPYPAQESIPLPEMAFGYNDRFGGEVQAGRVITLTASSGPLSLLTSPASGETFPGESYAFDVNATGDFDGLVDVWAYVPAGWQVRFDEVTLQTEVIASPGTPPGEYTAVLVAQARQFPEQIAVVEHMITLVDENTLFLGWQTEENISVPMGAELFPAPSNQTNDGETEIPDSAFRLGVVNASAQTRTISLDVSGAPAGWVVLNGKQQTAASFELGPNERAQVGLYILPPSLPAAGTSFMLNVQVSNGAGGVDNAAIPWSMPGQAFNYLTVEPAILYLEANSSADFTMQMTNVGNIAGTFALQAALPPLTATVTGLVSPLSLGVGETQIHTATLNAGNIPLGARFPMVIESPATDRYTQYAQTEVQIISPSSGAVFRAAEHAATACTLGEPGLSAALDSLAFAMVHLEASCGTGDCSLPLRDQVVNAARSVVLYAGTVSTELTGTVGLEAAADALASHSDPAEILDDLVDLGAAVTALDGEVCTWSQHKPALKWTPYYGAALQNETFTETLVLSNHGTIATTYDLTVTLPSSTISEQWGIAPGDVQTFTYPLTIADLGLVDLDAVATVVGQSNISAQSLARLNVVDRYVQLTAVRPTPDFVETGVSATTIFVDVNNVANVARPATAHTVIEAPGGGIQYTSDLPLTILVGAPRSYELQSVDTSGWVEGVYTVTVQLLDAEGDLIPDGSGYGYLGVGQLLGLSHAVNPTVASPGAITATTYITTELLLPGIATGTLNSSVLATPAGQPGLPGLSENQVISLPELPAPGMTTSTAAITRTENVNASIIYTGSWTNINNILSSHSSGGNYTVSSTPGNTATFSFDGTWVHIGFAKDRTAGQAEIIIDGISRGLIDLYYPASLCITGNCAASAVFGDLLDGPHTLEIVVTGTAHPNASGTEVRLDYIDTWDSTTYPDGIYEQDNLRIWRTNSWSQYVEPAASGGSFMNDGAVSNSGSVWFPFTGDSASFVALARYDSHRVSVSVDGVWQGNVLIYNATPTMRTYSFSGFGPGPHVMQVSAFREEPNIDAFITPAVGPDYDPPTYTGLVRYEEDHPALVYNGYDFNNRPASWSAGNAAQASEFSYLQSSTISDTVSLTFEGSWVNIGLRTRNRGGLAQVSIDGVNYGQVNAYTPGEDVVSYAYDVITGTHTLTLTVLGASDPSNGYNQVYLDYIETWDGSLITDTFQNARRSVESGRVHVSSSVDDGTHPDAIQGDFVDSGLPNSNSNVWYSFIGDSFTFYGLTVANGGSAEVYVDGLLIETISFDYPFSVQPLAFHYAGFGGGAHSVRIHNIWEMRVDGFASNQPSLPYKPTVEWYDNTPAGNGAPFFGTYGIAAGMAAGDLNGDGEVEIVVTADDVQNFGSMFVYRGDGADTGDGDPILWMHDFGGGVFRTWVGSPALADLDGQPGAEIVVAAGNELYAFYGDGTTYWVTDTVSIFETLTSPAIGNLDLDPEPEIVVNLGNTLEVRSHDGNLLWSTVFPATVNPPVLADLNGDGLLDIVLTGWDDDVLVYDFNYGSPQLIWSQTLASSMSGTFGAPAVADIDGLQPGGDPGPEVAIASNGRLTVLDGEDGALVWSTPLDPGNPGGVSIAELDGDGEMEILTGMRYEFETGRFGMLYALNADGTILWDAVAEDSTSANNASALDLDGDGIYEIVWNGREQGFTIFNGVDGTVLFNEPLVNSFTGTDYPLIVDTDNDGQAEVIVPALGGIRVFGNGSAWGEARPLWNQHSYHITNINDNLSVPVNEPNSWDVHNTYRTQTPLRYPMPVFSIALTHTVGISGVEALTSTFNVPPDFQLGTNYGWEYSQTWEKTVVTRTFNSLITGLLPGESRLVAQGTAVDYRLPSGMNHVELPPLYVSVPHIIGLEPASQTIGSGATAVFTVTLSNPGQAASVYTPTVAPVPGVDFGLLAAVNIPAGGNIAIPLTATVASGAAANILSFGVSVETSQGGADQVGGELVVLGPLVEVEITPEEQTVPTGETAVYNLSITNLENAQRTYELSGAGLAPVSLPVQVSVPANATTVISVTAQAGGEGANPFTVIATDAVSGISAQDTAVVIGEGFEQLMVSIEPGTVTSGPGAATPLAVTITNLGTRPRTYHLSSAFPQSWQASLQLLSQPVVSVLVAPGALAAVELQLLVSPPEDADPGDYIVSVTAQSQVNPLDSATADAVVQIGSLGVDVDFASGPVSLPPGSSGVWQVEVTNTGDQADTYDLAVFGQLAVFAEILPSAVSLDAGQSQTVQVTVSDADFALPGEALLGVYAQSQAQAGIQDEAVTGVTISALEALVMAWLPASQIITSTLSTAYTLVITNTGNVVSTFGLTIDASPDADISVGLAGSSAVLLSVPAFSSASIYVAVTAPRNGIYTLVANAQGISVEESALATLRVNIDGLTMYFPLIFR